jgi:hypothetical protein
MPRTVRPEKDTPSLTMKGLELTTSIPPEAQKLPGRMIAHGLNKK